jgi:DNA-binding transcriptional LysR family regulator
MYQFALDSDEALLLLEFEKSESIAEVAEKFKRDPSVISRSLKKLSEKLPVLEKVHSKWIITELGRKFNGWTIEALLAQNSILNKKVQLKIGSTREFANRFLIGSISKIFPKEKYDIHIITFEKDGESLLLNGHVDIVFDCGKPYEPQIAFKRPSEEKMSLIVSSEFKSTYNVNSANDLCLLPHIHYLRNNIAKLYNMTKDQINIGLSVNDIALVRAAVLDSEGWGMLPTYTVKNEIESGVLIEIKQEENWELTSYKFGVWWNRDKKYLLPYVGSVVDWLTEQDLN